MIHASRELIEAMKGRAPPRIPSDLVRRRNPQDRLACVVTMRAGLIPAVAACIGMGADRNAGEDKNEVDCPACLALMAEARGAERTAELLVYADQLEGVVAAYRRALVEAPECARPRHLRAEDGLCGAPLELVENNDGFNHRAKPGDRLVCVGCGYGTVGTNAAVAAVRALDALEKSAERARRSIAAIRSAVPVVPGVAEETAA